MSVELFRKVEEANKRLENLGWCDLEKANALAAMVVALRPNLVVELGVFGGRSLQAFAIPLKHLGCGTVIGIDPWHPGASLEGMADEANKKWWSELDHERIYQSCLQHLKLSDVESVVQIMREKSDDVDPSTWEISILHTDGNHEETAYRDTIRFAPRIIPGGLCIMDDTGWSSGAPRRGVEWLLANGFIELYALGTGAVYQRIG